MTYDTTRTHNPQGTQQGQQGKKSKKDIFVALIPKIKLALLATLAFFAFLNIQPYIRIVELMLESVTEWGLITFLAGLPLIGWVMNFLSGIGTSLLGVILWGIVQFFELLPALLKRNRPQIKLLIEGLERSAKLTPTDADDKMVQRLKQLYNTMPNRMINRAMWVAGAVYVVDFLLCIWTFPPLKGGIDRLSLFLMAPSWQDIDVKNALSCVVTLFAVEAIYHAYNWLDNMLKMFGRVEVQPNK